MKKLQKYTRVRIVNAGTDNDRIGVVVDGSFYIDSGEDRGDRLVRMEDNATLMYFQPWMMEEIEADTIDDVDNR